MKRKVPFKEQMNETECGISCVAMISSYYGNHVDLVDLRDLTGSTRAGSTLLDLHNICKSLNMDTKAYKVKANDLNHVKLPAILHYNSKHFVVLEKIRGDTFFIVDPDQGREKVTKSEMSSLFSGYILIPYPNKSFQTNKPRPLWKPYLKLLLECRRNLIIMLLVSIILQVFVLLSPILTQYIIDSSISNHNILSFSSISLAIVIAFLMYFGFYILRNEISIQLFKYLDIQLSWKYFSHLMNIPFSFFQSRNSGDLLYRFSNLRSLRNILSSQIMQSILDIILIVTIFCYMLYVSMELTLIMLLLTVVLCASVFSFRFKMNDLNKAELNADTKLFSIQSESIKGIHDIKASGKEEATGKKWSTLYKDFADAFVKRERLFGVVTSISSSLAYFIPVIIIFIGIGIVTNDGLTLGELIAFQSISTYFVSTSNSLIMQLDNFYQIKIYLTRLQDVFEVPSEYTGEENLLKHEIDGSIEFENVSFSYARNGNDVIKNASFKIDKGEKIAIVGRSGSGKSTLANLIVGLHRPEKGRIYYDNVLLQDIDKPSLRKQIGIVTQTPFLFNQSVYENIVGNRDDISFESVVEATKIAQIHDEIIKLPLSYHTVLSEQGQNFSGGQIQRIAIARAIVNNPQVVIFDEATNSLDSITEKKIDDYLSSLKSTRIIIAHRLSTIKNADKIIVMHDGRVIAQGSHEELLNANDYYRTLYLNNEALEV